MKQFTNIKNKTKIILKKELAQAGFLDYLTGAKNRVRVVLAQFGFTNPFRRLFNQIEFETTTYCNRKCLYCPNLKYQRVGAEAGRYMKEETFKKLLQDLKEINFKGLIAPHFYGEPLTDLRLADWLGKIRKTLPDSTIKVVTNADYFSQEKYEELIRVGVNYFYISKHSAEFSSGFRQLFDSLTQEEREKRIKIIDFYQDYQREQTMLNTRGGEVKLKKKKHHPLGCFYVTYPVIDNFGNVVLCCNDYHSSYIFGNINERPLRDIWQDPKNIKLRKRIYQGHFDLPICKNCWV